MTASLSNFDSLLNNDSLICCRISDQYLSDINSFADALQVNLMNILSFRDSKLFLKDNPPCNINQGKKCSIVFGSIKPQIEMPPNRIRINGENCLFQVHQCRLHWW